jgi:heptosyltransferase II
MVHAAPNTNPGFGEYLRCQFLPRPLTDNGVEWHMWFGKVEHLKRLLARLMSPRFALLWVGKSGSIRPASCLSCSVLPALSMRIGVFLPNWVGDVVMATPALRALSKLAAAHDGALVGIMRPYVADVLAGNNWLDEQIVYDKPRGRFSLASSSVIGELRAAKLDRVVLLTNSLRTAWMAWRSGAGERIGYVGDMRAWLLTHRLLQPRPLANDPHRPTIDSYLQLAEAAGCGTEPPRMELSTSADDERGADDVWRRLELPAGERVVVLNPGGAFGVAKHWPAEHFAELARRIVAEHAMHVLVNCGPAERHLAEEIVARASERRVVSLAAIEKVPIGLAKAVIRRSGWSHT